jgi:hypothetical protein
MKSPSKAQIHIFEGTNTDQLRGLSPVHPNQGGRSRARWLEGHGPNVLQYFGRDC